jgi:hypothetical protein
LTGLHYGQSKSDISRQEDEKRKNQQITNSGSAFEPFRLPSWLESLNKPQGEAETHLASRLQYQKLTETHLDNPLIYQYTKCYREDIELNMKIKSKGNYQNGIKLNREYYRPNPTCQMLRDSLMKQFGVKKKEDSDYTMTLSDCSSDEGDLAAPKESQFDPTKAVQDMKPSNPPSKD